MPMRIVVCVKQISLILARTGDDPHNHFVSKDDWVQLINPYDLVAVEAALRIKNALGAEILLVTLGPLIAEERLRRCWAMGADELLQIEVLACEEPDHHQKAVVLADVIAKKNPDLILCGQMSLDSEGEQTGARLAARLNMPYASRVLSMEIEEDLNRVTAARALERGDREVIQCELPAVLSVQLALNRPRYPALHNVLRSKQERIPKICVQFDGAEQFRRKNRKLQTCIGFSLPKPRPRKVFSPDRQSSSVDRIRQLMSGGSQKRETKIHTGQPEVLSDKCIDFLEKNGFLRETCR